MFIRCLPAESVSSQPSRNESKPMSFSGLNWPSHAWSVQTISNCDVSQEPSQAAHATQVHYDSTRSVTTEYRLRQFDMQD